MTLLRYAALSFLALLLPLAAQAQSLKPGLWEHQSSLKSADPQMEAAMARMKEQMAAMPPEQRQQMEAMMARQGMSLGAGPAGGAGPGMTVKVCLTPEQAARNEVAQHDGHCKQTSSSRSGNTVKFKIECSAPQNATGEGEFTVVSDKEHKGRLNITSQRGGKTQTMEITHSARWLGADCGDIKPRPAKP